MECHPDGPEAQPTMQSVIQPERFILLEHVPQVCNGTCKIASICPSSSAHTIDQQPHADPREHAPTLIMCRKCTDECGSAIQWCKITSCRHTFRHWIVPVGMLAWSGP